MIGIISDIHANEEALSAVLASMGRVGVLVCLGDIVGYGASPDACITLVRRAGAKAIMGNHEAGLLGTLGPSWFNEFARAALDWQRTRISAENLEWIAALPCTLVLDDVLLVHGTPPSSCTTYTLDRTQVGLSMRSVRNRICLVGHTHLPAMFRRPADARVESMWQQIRPRPNFPERFAKTDRLLINPGSVGQPRDHCALASYGLLDPRRGTVTIRRVPYALREAQEKIESAGLPAYLAARLAAGH